MLALGINRSGYLYVYDDGENYLGWGGVFPGEPFEAGLCMAPEARRFPLSLARAIKRIIQHHSERRELVAYLDEAQPRAAEFLNWLGFLPIGIQNDRMVYICPPRLIH